ncbi:MAG: site-specific DNA-methyltransferase [Candidatus Dojkabacteria bacterium]|nr:site-specific DNA-methyltransferase [Candidatus Dojkabacteria bacterium]
MKINQVLLGDSEKILKDIDDNMFDFVFTSPPYNINKAYEGYNDNLDQNEYLSKMKSIFSECFRVLKPNRKIAVNLAFAMKDQKNEEIKFVFYDIVRIINEVGFNPSDFILWIKSNKNSFVNGSSSVAWGSWMSAKAPVIRADAEAIFIFSKGSYKREDKGESTMSREEFLEYTRNVWFVQPERTKYSHVCPYPKELAKRLIKLYTYKNDFILDPFCGSGTTLVAAAEIERNFLGIDISEHYVKIALERIQNVQRDII